jgi:hypothetical protein
VSASVEAVSALLTACESATEEELVALGRAAGSLVWTDDTAPGAALFLVMIRLALAVYVERVAPDADLDEVLAVFAEVHGG